MEKYVVTVWFKVEEIKVTAKNLNEAKKKAYEKLKKKSALSYVNKNATAVW